MQARREGGGVAGMNIGEITAIPKLEFISPMQWVELRNCDPWDLAICLQDFGFVT